MRWFIRCLPVVALVAVMGCQGTGKPEPTPTCASIACSAHGYCTTTQSGPQCACQPGFTGDGVDCKPNELGPSCATVSCGAHASCVDTLSGPSCSCDLGYGGDGRTCTRLQSITTCATTTCHADAFCADTEDGARCACNRGFAGDGRRCVAVPTCATNNGNCDPLVSCTDRDPVRVCGSCPVNYSGTGDTVCVPPPMWIESVFPTTFNTADGVCLNIQGQGFDPLASVRVAGVVQTITYNSPTLIQICLEPYSVLPGEQRVTVRNYQPDILSETGVAQVQVTGAPLAPSVVELRPPFAESGHTARVLGHQLSGQTVTLTDWMGNSVTASSTGSFYDPMMGTLDYAEFTVPTGFGSGELTVSTPEGSVRTMDFITVPNRAITELNTVTASSETLGYPATQLTDGDMTTAWFAEYANCASQADCTGAPWVALTFDAVQPVGYVRIFGERSFGGYQVISAELELIGASGELLWGKSVFTERPLGDLTVAFPETVQGVKTVRLRVTRDQSMNPGLAEIEIH